MQKIGFFFISMVENIKANTRERGQRKIQLLIGNLITRKNVTSSQKKKKDST